MRKNLKQLELKKLFKEFSFLKIDEEYKVELQNTYGSDFEHCVKKIFEENSELNAQFNNGGQCNTTFDVPNKVETRKDRIIGIEIYNPNSISSETLPEIYIGAIPNDPSTIFKGPKDNIVKKLYRTISTKTHPDKVSNKFLNDIYIKAQNAYSKNDVFTLYLICNDLDIPYEFPPEEISAFKTNIKTLHTNNIRTEQTYLWAWIHEEDETKRKMILLHFITNAYQPKI